MVQAPLQHQTLSLQIPAGLSLHVTIEQFVTLAAANRDLRLERTTTGELIVTPPTGVETGYRSSKIIYFLVRWIEEEGGYGRVFDSSTGFTLPNGAKRSPDASWVSPERWEAITLEQRKGFAPVCPDFVVELRSETDALKVLQAKMQEYITNGSQLGWLIDPKSKRVEIYRPDQNVEVLDDPEVVSGEAVLPGFRLDLKRVWG